MIPLERIGGGGERKETAPPEALNRQGANIKTHTHTHTHIHTCTQPTIHEACRKHESRGSMRTK